MEGAASAAQERLDEAMQAAAHELQTTVADWQSKYDEMVERMSNERTER